MTTNRVSRQNVCVGASNVSVFYVYESRCNLSDKGALIDTFGRLSLAGREGHRASNPATARLQTQTSLCLATGYKIYTATPATANIIPASITLHWTGSVTLCKIAKLPHSPARAKPVFAGICTVSQCEAGRGSSPGSAVQICFSVWLTFELVTQQTVT